jgi:hypothetical protein
MKCNRYGIVLRLLACTALLMLATSAFAQKVSEETPPDQGPAANCDLTGYKSVSVTYSPAISVPDNNPAGVTTPPLALPDDGDIIADLVVNVGLTSTWVGDLVATLTYDPDCNPATPGSVASTFLCRPRGTAAGSPAPCGTTATAGCLGDLLATNSYTWDDAATGPAMADGVCPSTIVTGCYKPSPGGSPLSIFRNQPKGGCFTLSVSDRAGADFATIRSLTVNVRNTRPIAVEPKSWGEIKVLYGNE